MSGSEQPESDATTSADLADASMSSVEAGLGEVDDQLDRLGRAVETLMAGFTTMRDRAQSAEQSHRKLAEALRDTEVDSLAPVELQKRLEHLTEENERLRGIVNESRQRAERIRSRLIVLEDELTQ